MAGTGKRIMAIGGHIGDMELTAGALLAKCSLSGGAIMTVAMTAGERGNPPTMTPAEYRVQKVHEAELFAKMLGGEAVVFDTPDGELEHSKEEAVKLAALIRRFKPDLLVTHWEKSIHKDHAATHRIVRDAQFFAGLPSFPMDLPAHYAGGPYFAENWEDPYDYKPLIYVDIAEGYELWKKAVALHWFVTGSSSFRYLEYYDHLQVVRGCETGMKTRRAETFMVDSFSQRRTQDSL
jgi:LmbE family N-acetylglucosaminyl deacetylase